MCSLDILRSIFKGADFKHNYWSDIQHNATLTIRKQFNPPIDELTFSAS